MENIHLIRTSNGNCYLYNFDLSRLFLIHPLLFLELSENDHSDNGSNYYKNKIEYLRRHKQLNFDAITPEFANVSEDSILKSIIDTNQITFEVTDRCNLDCVYCGYGDLYDNYDKRKGADLNIGKAKKIIDTFAYWWSSNKNLSTHKIINIGFYGGEPLLNMAFVKEIVEHVKKISDANRLFTFSMTTNALLLNKYIDYLAINDFDLLISLDGDHQGNMNRVDKKGDTVFEHLINNIDLLRKKHPDYFIKHVNFNAVLHDKNPIDKLYFFFKQKYNKVPRTSTLSNTGRKKGNDDIFENMSRNINLEIDNSKQKEKIIKWMGVTAPGYFDLINFVNDSSGAKYIDYNELINNVNYTKYIPSGTCLPFSRKIFITVNSKILPCERVGQNIMFGHMDGEFSVDAYKMASIFNSFLDKIKDKCGSCYNYKSCTTCLLQNNGECDTYMNESSFNNKCQYNIEVLEEKPNEYKKIKTKVLII